MNEQLPPVDPHLKGQLARRSGRRLPEELLPAISAALDGLAPGPAERRWPSFGRISRPLAAAFSLGVVALLVVGLVALPRLQPGPGVPAYPTDRALTTAELAALMSGPPLPTNAALVANVSLDFNAACPLQSYPTIAFVKGMNGQVCVVASSADLVGHLDASGTFAFRYLLPGYLGLLGEVSPASSSRLAFQPSDEWPSGGQTFLVDGWLHWVPSLASCPAFGAPNIGDVLNVPADTMPHLCWQSALTGSAKWEWPIGGSAIPPTPDSAGLYGGARNVDAQAARLIDSIPADAHGTYVVRRASEQCPGAGADAAPGCWAWRVLARLADISIPSVNPSPPSGYPIDRALTTAQLAALMSGPTLATNTAIVASVTIDARTDVCPMDRYPTIGVIEGMDSQVCVMGAGVSAYLKTDKVSGVFAFRYLARGVLGLVGKITTQSSTRLAFHVADEWPADGQFFLVNGWLGSQRLVVSCPTVLSPGDILSPNSQGCPEDNWLSDDPTASGIASNVPIIGGGPLDLFGQTRYVQADAARHFDSIDSAVPVWGTYVVRAVACQGESPISAGGCGSWRVLAKLADISIPSVTSSPTFGYPTEHSMTTAQLATLMSGPPLATNTAIVASVTIDARTDVCPMDRYPTVGVIEGMDSQVCVMGAGVSAYLKTDKVSGVFAFRYLARGVLGLLGLITPVSDTKLAFVPSDDWPHTGQTFLINGWLGEYPISCPTYEPVSPGDPLNPTGTYNCSVGWISDDPTAAHSPGGGLQQPPGRGHFVMAFGAKVIDGIDYKPTKGVYVVRSTPNGCPGASDCAWLVLARLADDPFTATAAPGTPFPTDTSPSSATPASPIPAQPTGTAPLGLAGPGGRPLTVAEFTNAWTADPDHLAGRIVLTKGPIPTGFECWSAGEADASAPPGTCHLAVLEGTIAPEGYWAVKVGADGRMSVLGELSTPNGEFVASAPMLATQPDGLYVVDGWLHFAGDRCDILRPTNNPPCSSSWLSDAAGQSEAFVQPDAYATFGSGEATIAGVHAFWLVRVSAGSFDQILARLTTL